MSEENLNHEEDIIDETTNNGEGSENISEVDQAFIDRVNEETGKDFKNIEGITKSLKQSDKDFAEKGQQTKKIVSQNNDIEMSEELLLIKNPEAETVLDDIQIVADSKYNGNKLQAYRNETWLQEKATNEMQKEENIKKIKSPSSSVRSVEPSAKVTDEDKRIADKFFSGDITRYMKTKK